MICFPKEAAHGNNSGGGVKTAIEDEDPQKPKPDGPDAIHDRGGTRSGRDRRKKSKTFEGSERRSGRDRRRGFDRRSGIERRRSSERRNGRHFWNEEFVERRDVFRRWKIEG
jgi:hypothetical protein